MTYMLLMLDMTMNAGKLSRGVRNMSTVSRKKTPESISSEKGFESVKKLLENDPKNMWTSRKFTVITQNVVILVLSRQDLVVKLADVFGKDLVVLPSPVLANTLAISAYAAGILNLHQDYNDNSQNIRKFAQCMLKKMKDVHIAKGRNAKRINKSSASGHKSDFEFSSASDICGFVQR